MRRISSFRFFDASCDSNAADILVTGSLVLAPETRLRTPKLEAHNVRDILGISSHDDRSFWPTRLISQKGHGQVLLECPACPASFRDAGVSEALKDTTAGTG